MNPESRGLKRLVELRETFANERELVLRMFLVEHEASPSGSLTSHVAAPGETVRLPSDEADDLVKRGLATSPYRP